MVSDALNPRAAFATLPTDHINYMRNAVKATVDAYTGKVTLYAWDDSPTRCSRRGRRCSPAW